jgi:FkbM family methyltransferase
MIDPDQLTYLDIGGHRFRIRSGDYPGCDRETIEEVFRARQYRVEFELTNEIDVVVDIGANVGAFSRFALSMFPHAQIFAYEPDPDTFKLLDVNTNDEWRIRRLACAVSNYTGVGHLSPGPGGRSGGGSHLDSDNRPGAIEVATIDIEEVLAVARAHGHQIFMKLDCEGAERWIIDRMGERAGNWECLRAIEMEFHGPAMPHLKYLDVDDFGPMVQTLAEHGRIIRLEGRPSRGGLISWRAFQ